VAPPGRGLESSDDLAGVSCNVGQPTEGVIRISYLIGGAVTLTCQSAAPPPPGGGVVGRDRAWLLVRDARHRVFLPEDVGADVEAGCVVAGVEPAEALSAGAVASCLGAGVAGGEEEQSGVGDRPVVEPLFVVFGADEEAGVAVGLQFECA
jgi:hypothetical protein